MIPANTSAACCVTDPASVTGAVPPASGIATISGALLAGVLASGGILTQLQGGATGSTSATQFAVSGLLLVVVVVFAPDGLAILAARGARRLLGRPRAGAETT